MFRHHSPYPEPMQKTVNAMIAGALGLRQHQVENTLALFAGGATVPFIARYRKEKTGGLDEVTVSAIREEQERILELVKRREAILRSIGDQGLLTEELRERIDSCWVASTLEDLYLPFRPKRRTRAAQAREKGLEPLARLLMEQREWNPGSRAKAFLNEAVPTVEEALAGARDILAEWIGENEQARRTVRLLFEKSALIRSAVVKGREEEAVKYKDYYKWSEPLKKCPSHRLLAMRRGEREGFLHVAIEAGREEAVEKLLQLFIRGRGASSDQVALAVKDSYSRLIAPSIEHEFAALSREKAEQEAIAVFTGNLRQLLLAPPLGAFRVMAIDPGFRSGCKVVCLDAQGNLLHNDTVYPHPPRSDQRMAAKKITSLAEAYQIEAIAIGNGTAGRETEAFIRTLRFGRELKVFSVSEDGASVYSASSVAREEFPQYDVTVRGAVSIGRRLMDPLAELVKIDPKSIGVGQYQHDVDQKKLKKSLDSVVGLAVNAVGVNLNTASPQLLSYVSGLGPQLAAGIAEYRKTAGPFRSRQELLKVPRLGARTFEQAAGFLRIPGAAHPLDDSAVHPESYALVEKMAARLQCPVAGLLGNEALLSQLNLQEFASDDTGLPTLNDIRTELLKPGRDPRPRIRVFEFAEGITRIEELQPGMVLPGIVNNITRFGAFVDIGVKQSGLVHLSEMADRFIHDPSEVVKLHQQVLVRVLEVDIPRKRIQLSLRQAGK